MECRRCAGCEQAFRPRAQFPGSASAGSRLVSVSGDDSGNGASVRADADYRANQAEAQREWAGSHRDYWRDGERRTPATPSAIVWSSAGAIASGTRHVLQRWTRQRRFRPFCQAPTAWCHGPVAILQRRMCARSNSQ